MNISLPEVLREWVDEQVAEGGFGTASEYIRHLLREARRRQLRSEIDERLIEGLDSGAATEMTASEWEDVRREGRRRLGVAKRRRPG